MKKNTKQSHSCHPALEEKCHRCICVACPLLPMCLQITSFLPWGHPGHALPLCPGHTCATWDPLSPQCQPGHITTHPRRQYCQRVRSQRATMVPHHMPREHKLTEQGWPCASSCHDQYELDPPNSPRRRVLFYPHFIDGATEVIKTTQLVSGRPGGPASPRPPPRAARPSPGC